MKLMQKDLKQGRNYSIIFEDVILWMRKQLQNTNLKIEQN